VPSHLGHRRVGNEQKLDGARRNVESIKNTVDRVSYIARIRQEIAQVFWSRNLGNLDARLRPSCQEIS
jgi:hypothetical protein